MTISSYFTVFAQSPSKAKDIAIARCAALFASGVAAESIARWKMTRASGVLPSISSRLAAARGPPRPPCPVMAARGTASKPAAASTATSIGRAVVNVNMTWASVATRQLRHGTTSLYSRLVPANAVQLAATSQEVNDDQRRAGSKQPDERQPLHPRRRLASPHLDRP